MVLLWIFIGGGVGSVSRYLLGGLVQSRAHPDFPIGTFVVNVIGCIIIGVVAKFFLHSQTQLLTRSMLMVGFCGGFTTFSAFSYETFGLISAGSYARAAGYVLASVIVCLGGTAIGFALAPSLNP
jgi:CrcB protein